MCASTGSKKKLQEDGLDDEADVVPVKVLRSLSSLKIHEKIDPHIYCLCFLHYFAEKKNVT